MPIPEQSTIEALQRLSWAKTHRAKCVALGLPASWRGTIGRILYGHMVGLDKENEVRLRLGLPQRVPAMIEVPPCEDCGDVHTGRCNGKPVAAVVVKAQRTPPPPWLAQAVRNLELCLERKRNGSS